MAQQRRVSLNLRVDPDKHAMLEDMRQTGFGLAQTERNRSDVYNEVLGYGLQVHMLQREVGEKDFQLLWKLLNKLNWEEISVTKLKAFVEA